MHSLFEYEKYQLKAQDKIVIINTYYNFLL